MSMSKLNSIHSASLLLLIMIEMYQIHLEVITHIALQSTVYGLRWLHPTSMSCIVLRKIDSHVFMKRTLHLCI